MKKYILGIVAVLAILFSVVQTVRVSALQSELADAREKAASKTASVQDRLAALEKQMTENRGETQALKASVQARSNDVAQLEKKIAAVEQKPGGEFANFMAIDPNGQAVREVRRWDANGVTTTTVGNGQMRMTRIAGDVANVQDAEATARQTNPAPAMKGGTAKLIDDKNDIVEMTSKDGKIIQQFRDPQMARRLRNAQPKAGAADAAGTPPVVKTTPDAPVKPPKPNDDF